MRDNFPNEGQPRKKKSGLLGRIIRRFFLVLFTVVILAVAALILVMNMVFNGPSPAARDVLTMSLIEASATKWVPALFIGEDTVAEIRTSVNAELEEDVTDTTKVIIQANNVITGDSNEWDKYPDGVRFEEYAGDTYNAHIMIVRDPAQVYMGTSTEKYSTAIPGLNFVPTVIARVVSSLLNFFMNKKLVFHAKTDTRKSMLRYYALAIPQLFETNI